MDAMPLASVTYAIADWLFLRALGVIYLAAFVSIGMQVKGLIGRDGILPAAIFLDDLKTVLGRARFAALPTLCWFGTSDRFLQCLAHRQGIAGGIQRPSGATNQASVHGRSYVL